MITVKCTREGLPGQRTATGYIIDSVVSFVALPSEQAKGRFVKLQYQGATTYAQVLDVGPWNEHDDAYVFQGSTDPLHFTRASVETRPQAEHGIDVSGNGKTNGAGIDLGEAVWKALGLPPSGGSATVSWEFL